MATANPSGQMSGAIVDPQLATLQTRLGQVRAAIERRAVEVVRAWLIEQGRTWLAVELQGFITMKKKGVKLDNNSLAIG